MVERLILTLFELRKHLDTEIDSESRKTRHILPSEIIANIDIAGQIDDEFDVTAAVDDAVQEILVWLEPVDQPDDAWKNNLFLSTRDP